MGLVIKSPKTEADLLEIWAYVAENNEIAADRLLDLIDQKMVLLSNSPFIGREREELAPNLRGFPVGSYIIFYRPIDRGIEIVRVLHGARDIENIF